MRTGYRSRWPLLLALIAGVGILVPLAYAASHRSGEAEPAPGGSYVEGIAGTPSIVNPLFASFNQADGDLSRLVFAGLVRLGPNGSVQPDLAELPLITPDGLSYIFELRSGLSWHDGRPLRTDDVAFTIALVQDPSFQGDPALRELFRDVRTEVRDERTIIVTLPQPYSPFLARAATAGILPKHLLEDVLPADIGTVPFNKRSVGSGPFELAKLSSEEAVLVPFDEYYGGRPRLENVTLRFYRDDAALLNALSHDEIDGALLGAGLTRDDIESIDTDGGWVRRTLHGTTFSVVYLNPFSPAFYDRLVRQALQFGLDREALIDDVLSGQGLALDSPIVRDLWAYVGSPDAYGYDEDRAASLLDAAGWELEGDMRAKDGEPLRFTLMTSDDPVQERVARAIAGQWATLGVRAEVQASGASQFVEGVLLTRQFQAALVVVDSGPDPDPYPLWDSTQATGTGRNLAGFSNATADELLENGRQTVSTADRAADYRQFQEIFARELPAVLLYTPTYEYVVRSSVQGLSPGLLSTMSARFTDVHKWFVKGTSGGE